ncbi:23S rRNA (guanosine(2251)-2'-O)-methyltransferase RlmB [Actinomyces sp. MRS3W]|uniref:23S rRNA (guanosine(2251)-2'-O)-methyltransferase RlmB n=1 Tax=Actinomyces sp. MRS3W TaxID=2800796 RepID=UPI0028FD0AAA|nr:23S rRNA (guanosine(2251)-2'-O)-methyltransferase RlmB [Actinomyces sp. MRS3W]MDU0349650.1 23S rRNA (guanosine(2251)-2'-O)-methyltransferase RlmB [Actinomyces sp. MRS3W]
MPGNDRRHGAVRNPGKKKAPTKGSGGVRRRGLEGKGPTPKAEDRVGHPKARAKARAEARAAQPTRTGQLEQVRSRWAVPEDHEIVCGRNAVAEAARARVPISRVFMASSAQTDDRLGAVVRRAALVGAPVVEVTKLDLEALTEGTAHQGVAIEVPAYEYVLARDLLARARDAGHTPLLVALDQVTDPHNLGAVLRSAGAFGVDGVIVPERRSAGVNATAWKVSAGAAARVPVARETNLVRALRSLKQEGCFVVGLEGGGETTIDGLALADVPLVVVTGAEGSGLSRLVRETCDQLVSIPIASTVESLNAAVATGIALYEIDRLRRKAADAATANGEGPSRG